MPTRQINVRLPQVVIDDLNQLAQVYGSQAKALIAAIVTLKYQQQERKMVTIINPYGREIDFQAAVQIMDDDIREALANDGQERNPQQFFDAYVAAHAEKYDEEWEPAKKNPVW